MNSPLLADQQDRDEALNISRSFIVQAPAGSGKTELLTLRYLKLLGISEQPEEVLAITFTRKAASEMRDRIINSISWASDVDKSAESLESELDRQRYEIANKVLAQDKKLGWHLLENPSRLRVQTIDSFCFYLANQMPVLSRLGGNPKVSEDIEICFVEAIANTLAELEGESEISDDIAELLKHLDNDVNRIERLLISLLYKRDQWLSHILDITASFDGAKAYLQSSLDELIEESLLEAREGLLPVEPELVELINYSANNLMLADKLTIPNFEPLQVLPEANFASLPYWHFLVKMLATDAGSWRKLVNIGNGFPASAKQDRELNALYKARKQQFSELRNSLSSNDDLLESLVYLRLLPNPAYEEQQWDFLAALTRSLKYLSGQLLLAFRKFRLIDYSQAGASARAALGTEENPTDLALALDHKIQHILVDEFQDTSKLQLEILEQLTHGWETNGGRTLFLVGDAMQSAYGFRDANVGIYLRVQQRGLGDIALQPLTLRTNFRSQSNLVTWINQMFESAFPQRANSSRGAVPYTSSVAVHPNIDSTGVKLEIISHQPEQRQAARQTEATRIIETIATIRAQQPRASIAVLVRARPHLNYIIPALREAGIRWQPTDIDRMESLPVIEDLLSLTQAILNQADRLAWLSILRAPWCGLNVGDLHAIESHAGEHSIWFALQQRQDIDGLSADARQRLEGFSQVLGFAMTMRYRQGLRQLIEACWTMLRGSSTTTHAAELDSAAQFFSLLEQHETAGGLSKMAEFRSKVARSFVPSRAIADDQDTIHLLTMHKAKGLEFDHVILPGLANKAPSDSKALLQWHQRVNRQGDSRLFIAALPESGSDEGMLYKLLRHEQQYKTSLESTRLLYIATTRARTAVHMFATVARNSKGELSPEKSSLLNRIWRELNQHSATLNELSLESNNSTPTKPDPQSTYPKVTPIKRLDSPLRLSATETEILQSQIHSLSDATAGEDEDVVVSESRQDHLATTIGILIHQSLEALVSSGTNLQVAPAGENMKRYWRLQLRHLLRHEDDLQQALAFIEQSVVNSVTHPGDGWVFDGGLKDSQCELVLTSNTGGQPRQFVIDRTFIDKHDVRWIIDYKTGKPTVNQDEESFVDSQCQLHAAQLKTYRELFECMETRPIKTALFFTSLPKLVELV